MSGRSALTARGSTRRWRRIRAYVLERDAFACRFVLDEETGERCGAYADHVHHIDPRARDDGSGMVDDPAKLAAACARHNLENGSTGGLVAAPRDTRPARPDWKW